MCHKFNFYSLRMKEPRKEIRISNSNGENCWLWRVYWYDENNNWMCSDMGTATSKREARRQANASECPCCSKLTKDPYKKEITIDPPLINAEVVNGHLCSFEMDNWQGKICKFTTSEIDENTAFWIFGLDCFDSNVSSPAKLVAAMLKIWGLYRGGNCKKSIMKLHNLNEEQFDMIVKKVWKTIIVKFDEQDNMYWDISV